MAYRIWYKSSNLTIGIIGAEGFPAIVAGDVDTLIDHIWRLEAQGKLKPVQDDLLLDSISDILVNAMGFEEIS